MAVCSQIHTKHINTLCGQKLELLNVELTVHIVTTGLWRVESVNVVQGNNNCSSQIHTKTHKYAVCSERRIVEC